VPVPPSISKAIRAVRREFDSPPRNDREALELELAVHRLFQKGDRLVANTETLGEVLALAPEVEAYRGKGSQSTASEFALRMAGLARRLKARLPRTEENPGLFPTEGELPGDAEDVRKCLGMLIEHFSERVRGPRVRSMHAAHLRALAWLGLEWTTDLCRRPEHLAHALEVAADPRASDEEREAAVRFLVAYWGAEEPDDATVELLRELESEPASRRMLVGVMQAQIDLGLNDGIGVMFAMDAWEERAAQERGLD
jgi:hypothetical protein